VGKRPHILVEGLASPLLITPSLLVIPLPLTFLLPFVVLMLRAITTPIVATSSLIIEV
jgi:hypothetical protein